MCRVAVSSGHDPDRAEQILLEWDIHGRTRIAIEPGLMDIADDADDVAVAVGSVADIDALPDRVLAREVAIDEGLIDDRHHRALSVSRAVKVGRAGAALRALK